MSESYLMNNTAEILFHRGNIWDAVECMVLKKNKDASMTYWGGAAGLPYVPGFNKKPTHQEERQIAAHRKTQIKHTCCTQCGYKDNERETVTCKTF